MAQTKTLFFINGTLPTNEDKELASKIEGKCCFRNVTFIDLKANIEDCDFVIGAVPLPYSEIPIYGQPIKETSSKANLENPNNEANVPINPKTKTKQEKVTVNWSPN